MNKLLLFSFISLFSLFGIKEDSFIAKLKNGRHFYPLSAGLLTSASLYGLSKTNFPLFKNIKNLSSIEKFLVCFGSGLAVGGLFLIFNNKANKKNIKIEEEKIEENKTGLIQRPKDFDFWLTDEAVSAYLEERIKIKKEKEKEKEPGPGIEEQNSEQECSILAEYINNIYKEHSNENEKKIKEQVNNFLFLCNIEECEKYQVRIFNEYRPFNDLVRFIEYVSREELLSFLRSQSTIIDDFQGKLIQDDAWETAEAGKLAAFLAFGYYADTCGEFLYLEPDRLMTFLENVAYYIYFSGKNINDHCLISYFRMSIPLRFLLTLGYRISEVSFKNVKIKKYPTKIIVKKLIGVCIDESSVE